MSKKINTIEQDLNEIRLAEYEANKDLSTEERLEKQRKESEAIAKEYGIKIISSVPKSTRVVVWVSIVLPMEIIEAGENNENK